MARQMYFCLAIFYIIGNFVPYDIKPSGGMRARTSGIMSQATVLGAAKCAPLDR